MTFISYLSSDKVTFFDAVNNFPPTGITYAIVVVIFLPFTTDTLTSLLLSTFSLAFYSVGSAKSISSLSKPISLVTHKLYTNRHLFLKFYLFFLLPPSYLFGILYYLSSFSLPLSFYHHSWDLRWERSDPAFLLPL